MGIEWRFDAGGPLYAPPAVGVDGAVYIGTADGYLLALDARGLVQWAYTLEGAIAWSPLVDRNGRIYVATTAQRLCSFYPNGVLGWQAKTPVHVGGELAFASPASVAFAGTDGNVWAYAEYGSAVWHAGVGPSISAGPRYFGGRAFVASVDGSVVVLDGAMRRSVVRVPGACDAIVGARPDGAVTLITGGALIGVGPKGDVRFRRDGVAWADSVGDGFIAVEHDGALTRLTSEGAVASHTPLGEEGAAAPVVAPSGAVYVAGTSGVLAIVGKNGTVRRVPVASAALHRPVLDVARRRVLVAAGSGIVASLRLED
jgi:outer membrane protein assembly factor BamB